MHPDWQFESERLLNITRFISAQLSKKLGEKDYLINQEADINRSMWEDSGVIQDLESISDFMQHIGLLKQNMAWARMTSRDIVRLDKQLTSPYFGRIDFSEGGGPPEMIYIGINTLTDDDTSQILIYDWRAPVCSMFYDYETGPASYLCPAGRIKGDMTLKRQYRIVGGKLQLMFDSNVAIHDDILQEILAGNTGSKMKNIVSTIQREQNAAIRDESTRLLSIQGSAGSGKTSVALHRASYLLYRHKKHIQSSNLVILSSTDVLGDYISDVLPELGEDAIKGITFKNVVSRHMPLGGMMVQSHPRLVEQILTSEASISAKVMSAIDFKSSPRFLKILDTFFDYALEHLLPMEDLVFKNQLILSKADMKQLFFKDFARMLPLHRLKRMENRIQDMVKPLKRSQQQQKARDLEEDDVSIGTREAKALSKINLRQEAQGFYDGLQRLLSVNAAGLYKKLFEDDSAWSFCTRDEELDGKLAAFIRSYTLENMNGRRIGFEDAGPLLYLSLRLGETDPDDTCKHLMVDEAQDYSLIQLLALQKLYPQAGITLLGDISQNISPYTSHGNLEQMASSLSPSDHGFIRLNKSYRSTLEISAFASSFLHGEAGENFGRHGDKPRMILAGDYAGMLSTLAEEISAEMKDGFKTLALITRTLADAKELHHAVKKLVKNSSLPVRLMQEDYDYPVEGIMVIPSYLAKGLEFDCVFVLFTQETDYQMPCEKGLLYTVLSRALHHLILISASNALPNVLESVDPASFETVQAQG